MADKYPPFPLNQYSSRKILDETLDKSRLHLRLANTTLDLSFNKRMERFDPEMWLIDYNAIMVATIIPMAAHGFKVPAQWRSNSDFLGVRWQSADNFNHHYFKYQENRNYTGMVLAFRANPTEPNKFTVTMTANGQPMTYRLAPYALNAAGTRYECMDTEYGTKRNYPASVIRAKEVIIPEDEMQEFKGRKDYIFILDFNDMRTTNSYGGPRIPPDNISQISFDCVESSHGLGNKAFMSLMTQLPNNEIEMELGGCYTNAVLSPGDKLQAIWRWYAPGTTQQNFREDEFVVKRFSGFGTSALKVVVEGTLPGIFAGCDAFYGRYLSASSPAGASDTVKYFYDFTMTGGTQSVGKRHYPQIPNGQGMTSGFDDGYNLTPERQVKMSYDLGYRDFWTCYVGMSHYFSARTAFKHKVTGALTVESDVLDFPVLYAGQSNAAIHFVAGLSPNRGVDAFQRKLTQLFNVNYGAIFPINGAVGSTAAERMCSPNPDSDVFDPLQTSGAGGLWWWDIERDAPGPALMNCLSVLDGRIPKAIIWSQGEQDAAAIAFPSTRNPVPSYARSKLATQKIFAYFRSLWGSTLPILVQEQGYGWNVTTPSNPSVPMLPGMPTYMRAKRNSWGDIVFSWLTWKESGAGKNYKVEVYHPDFPTQIIRTLQVSGSNLVDGAITCDYPAELAGPDSFAIYGYNTVFSFLRFKVTQLENTQVTSEIYADVVELDNSFVEKTVVFGLNNLAGGYFTDLSDSGASGNTGIAGQKDKVAASTFRKALAAKLNLRDVQVMPINVSASNSALNPAPYIPRWDPSNYWWNPVTNSPGPRLMEADAIVKALGVAPDYFVESATEEATGLRNVTDSTEKAGYVEAWRTSNIAMLAWMRANWGNANLPIWMQGATSTWFSPTVPPNELTWNEATLIRNAQKNLGTNQAGFNIGSYVPNGGDYTSFRNEQGNWVNYTVATYHALATEMANSIADNNNLANQPAPIWTLLRPPTNGFAIRQVSNDILMTWTGRPESVQYRLKNLNVNSGNILNNTVFTGPRYVFTQNEQIAAYNQKAFYVIAEVSEYLSEGNLTGPLLRIDMPVAETDVSMPALSNLQVRYMGEPEEIPNGGGALKPRDIRVTWEGPNDGIPYWLKNLRADVALFEIQSSQWTQNYYTFSIADQIAQYGFGANAVNIEIAKYNGTDQTRGPILTFVGKPNEPLKKESIA
uniref:160 kDa protein n=1 Tax=Pseudomonas phage Arace01 TaxID=3138526 RepID=A0AAU6W0F1_9VIRU